MIFSKTDKTFSFNVLLNVVLLTSIFFFSCKTTEQEEKFTPHKSHNNEVQLIFLGDVMAHTANFSMKDYSIIWDDIRKETSGSDFTFANIEAPVSDDLPFMNYPNFNMQFAYPQAAIDAGINVITTANNHTNDQFEDGIRSTKAWSELISSRYSKTSRPVYFSGLKQDVSSIELASNSPVSYAVFEKNNIKIIFFGATQLLNTRECNQMINYFPGTVKGREKLLSTVKTLRQENPCDLFVLALHTDEPEYVLTVTEERKAFYYQLLDAGVDILWANHPHTPKPVEYIGNKETGKITKAIFYATGNTISAQRYKPNFEHPEVMREYTGDGFMITLDVKKKKDSIYIDKTSLKYITTFTDSSRNILIKYLNKQLIEEMENNELNDWKDYYTERIKLLNELKETTTWQ